MSIHELTDGDVKQLQNILEKNRLSKGSALSSEMCGAIRITLAITNTNCKFLAEVLETNHSNVLRHAKGQCECATDVPQVETIKTGVKHWRFENGDQNL